MYILYTYFRRNSIWDSVSHQCLCLRILLNSVNWKPDKNRPNSAPSDLFFLFSHNTLIKMLKHLEVCDSSVCFVKKEYENHCWHTDSLLTALVSRVFGRLLQQSYLWEGFRVSVHLFRLWYWKQHGVKWHLYTPQWICMSLPPPSSCKLNFHPQCSSLTILPKDRGRIIGCFLKRKCLKERLFAFRVVQT